MTPTNKTPPQAHRPHHGHDDHLYDQAEFENEDVSHEHSDVNVRAILASGVGMFVVVGVCALIVLGLFNFLESQAAKNDPVLSPLAHRSGQNPPEPRLLINEPANLERFREELTPRLQGIDQGKKQLLQQGLPARAGAPADAWLGTRSPARGESSGGRAIPIRPGGGL